MAGKLASAATTAVIQLITAPGGMNSSLAGLIAPDNSLAKPLDSRSILAQNVASELTEQSRPLTYPLINVYCDKISNDLREKFRSFSGSVQTVIEVRHSQDRLDGLQEALELYVDSITAVLDSERGDWGNGMFFTGEYQISVGAAKHGGKNYIQAAKITFPIAVSRS